MKMMLHIPCGPYIFFLFPIYGGVTQRVVEGGTVAKMWCWLHTVKSQAVDQSTIQF